MATHSGLGGVPAVLYGLAVGLVVGLINGVGIALLRVQPLVMTLGTGLMTEGMLVVYSQKMMADAPHVPQFIEDLGAGKFLGGIPERSPPLGADRHLDHLRVAPHGIWPAALRRRRQQRGLSLWQAFGSGGCCWSITSLAACSPPPPAS